MCEKCLARVRAVSRARRETHAKTFHSVTNKTEWKVLAWDISHRLHAICGKALTLLFFSLSSIFTLRVIATIIETNTKKRFFSSFNIYQDISIPYRYRKNIGIFRYGMIPKNIGMDFQVSVYTEKISVWILKFRYIPKKYRYGFSSFGIYRKIPVWIFRFRYIPKSYRYLKIYRYATLIWMD